MRAAYLFLLFLPGKCSWGWGAPPGMGGGWELAVSLYWALWPELSSPGRRASGLLDYRLDWPTPPDIGGTSQALTPTPHRSSQAGALENGHAPRHREPMLFL